MHPIHLFLNIHSYVYVYKSVLGLIVREIIPQMNSKFVQREAMIIQSQGLGRSHRQDQTTRCSRLYCQNKQNAGRSTGFEAPLGALT